MSYQKTNMHSGQGSPAPKGNGQLRPCVFIDDIETYLLRMADVDSINKAESYYNMLRDLFITDPSWRDNELKIYSGRTPR